MSQSRMPGLVLLAALFLAAPAPAAAPPARMTAEQSTLRQRHIRLFRTMQRHAQEGQLDEALAVCRRVLEGEKALLGPAHPSIDTLLGWLVVLRQRKQDWQGALAAERERLAVLTQLHGAGHWRLVTPRLNIRNMELLARFSPAERKRWDRSRDLTEQAVRLHQRGKIADALERTRQSMRLQQPLLGEKHPHYLENLGNLAALVSAAGNDQRSRQLRERLVEQSKEVFGEQHPKYAHALHQLGYVCSRLGEYSRARSLFEESLVIRRRTLGRRHPDIAVSLNSMGVLLLRVGEARLARDVLEQAVVMQRELRGERDPHTVLFLEQLGAAWSEAGDQERAREILEHVVRLTEELYGQEDDRHAGALHNLASLYFRLRDYQQALRLNQRCVEVRRRLQGVRHPQYIDALTNLALVYREVGVKDKARELFRQALGQYRKTVGPRHPDYASCLLNYAGLLGEMGTAHRAECERVLRECQALAGALGQASPYQTVLLGNLAQQHRLQGRYADALRLGEQAAALLRQQHRQRSPEYAILLGNLALVHRDSGNHGGAVLLAAQAVDILVRHLQDTEGLLSERQRLQALDDLSGPLHLLLDLGRASVPVAILCEKVLAFKGLLAAEQHRLRHVERTATTVPLLEKLLDTRARLAELATRAPADQAAWQEQFDRLEQQKEQLQLRLARASRSFARLQEKLTAARVARALPERTALVEFVFAARGRWRGDQPREELLAFVLRRDRSPVLLPLGRSEPIRTAIRAWRAWVVRPAARTGPDPGEALRARLWLPLARHLDGIDTVLIGPDQELCQLPFAALPGKTAGSYLLESVAIAYVTSARQLLAPAASPGDGLFAVGGLEYGPVKSGRTVGHHAKWRGLPATALEVEQVVRAYRKHFPRAAVLEISGSTGRRDTLLAGLAPTRPRRAWRYLHLGTHAWFERPTRPQPPLAAVAATTAGSGAGGGLAGLVTGVAGAVLARDGFPEDEGRTERLFTRNPLLATGLVPAGANRTGERVSGEAIAGLDLRGCDLAVLGACETGLGRLDGLQGVQGLQSAFHQAGARSVVASLWSVSDLATSVLMERFYANLWDRKMTRLQALRDAQLHVLKNPQEVRARARQLLARLNRQGLPAGQAVALRRGIEDEPEKVEHPAKPPRTKAPRSPVAWWAGWALSGDIGR